LKMIMGIINVRAMSIKGDLEKERKMDKGSWQRNTVQGRNREVI
jgi:hypothetical protein